MKNRIVRKPSVIDLFCGAGGLSYGFEQAGFRITVGVDNDPEACRTFEANHSNARVIASDIRKVSAEAILDLADGERPDVVVGGPSCQGFSTVGPRDFSDPRNAQFREFVRLVRDLKPKCVLMENVVGLLLYKKGQVGNEVCELFGELGYATRAKILLAADFGVPQLRRRVFFIGTALDVPVAFPKPTHSDPELWAEYALPFAELSSIGQKNGCKHLPPHITVAEAIDDLPPLGEMDGADVSEYESPPRSNYQKTLRGYRKHLFNHVSGGHSPAERKMIRALKPGENWRALPKSVLPKRFEKIRPYDASTLIMRLRWDRPSYTITTKSAEVTSGAFIHPEQDRTISVREAARLQSFPDRFRFYGSQLDQRRQIGNSVPPLLAERLAGAVMSMLEGHSADRDDLVFMEPEASLFTASA